MDRKWQYEGIPNRQIWLLPKTNLQNGQKVSAEVRGGSDFPGTQAPIPGGPVIQNVRITVPMPATDPVWLEIAPDPKPDNQ